MPAHIAKEPARIGARFFIIIMPPKNFSLLGEKYIPRPKCQAAPMRHPMEKPPPRSSTILKGQGFYRIMAVDLVAILLLEKLYQYIIGETISINIIFLNYLSAIENLSDLSFGDSRNRFDCKHHNYLYSIILI